MGCSLPLVLRGAGMGHSLSDPVSHSVSQPAAQGCPLRQSPGRVAGRLRQLDAVCLAAFAFRPVAAVAELDTVVCRHVDPVAQGTAARPHCGPIPSACCSRMHGLAVGRARLLGPLSVLAVGGKPSTRGVPYGAADGLHVHQQPVEQSAIPASGRLAGRSAHQLLLPGLLVADDRCQGGCSATGLGLPHRTGHVVCTSDCRCAGHGREPGRAVPQTV